MKKTRGYSWWIFGGLMLLLLMLAQFSRKQREEGPQLPAAAPRDSTPLGGKGLWRVLEKAGISVRTTAMRLQGMPRDAGVWLLLDPQTGFSRREGEQLLQWVFEGGTLIYAVGGSGPLQRGLPATSPLPGASWAANPGRTYLMTNLRVRQESTLVMNWIKAGDPLPALAALPPAAPGLEWQGVKQAFGSADAVDISRTALDLAGDAGGPRIARVKYGRGAVILSPDALVFTNYALARPDTAVLVTNLLRLPLERRPGLAVYWDERRHAEEHGVGEVYRSIWYYLWRPPLRYAILQLLLAGILWWFFYGTRHGRPVPLPAQEPVTRASHFALAMGTLLERADRPQAAGRIIGAEFRRILCRHTGLAVRTPDAELAQRVAAVSGVPVSTVDYLLLQASAPEKSAARVLHDVRQMEQVLLRLNRSMFSQESRPQ